MLDTTLTALGPVIVMNLDRFNAIPVYIVPPTEEFAPVLLFEVFSTYHITVKVRNYLRWDHCRVMPMALDSHHHLN